MKIPAALCLFALVVCVSPSLSDVVHLKNGDRITGVIVLDQEGELVIETEYGGKIEIQWMFVDSVLSDDPVPVQLKNGEHFKGVLVESDPGTIKVLSEEGGETVPIPIDSIAGIRLSKEDLDEADYWSGGLSAGLSISDGNVRRQTFYARAEAERDAGGSRLSLQARSDYAREDGQENDKNHYGQLKLDVFVYEDLYAYGLVSLEYDRFSDIDLRTIVSGGLGYRLYRSESHQVDIEGGVAYTNEDIRHGDDNGYASLRLAARWRWRLSDRLRLRSQIEFLPNVEKFKDFLVHGESFLLMEIFENFNIEAGVVWDHDQIPPADRNRNDTLYLLGVTYRF